MKIFIYILRKIYFLCPPFFCVPRPTFNMSIQYSWSCLNNSFLLFFIINMSDINIAARAEEDEEEEERWVHNMSQYVTMKKV